MTKYGSFTSWVLVAMHECPAAAVDWYQMSCLSLKFCVSVSLFIFTPFYALKSIHLTFILGSSMFCAYCVPECHLETIITSFPSHQGWNHTNNFPFSGLRSMQPIKNTHAFPILNLFY